MKTSYIRTTQDFLLIMNDRGLLVKNPECLGGDAGVAKTKTLRLRINGSFAKT